MKKKVKARFSFPPLLFLLLPIALLIFPIFIGFKDPEYVYISVNGKQGLSAAISLYRCFSIEGSVANGFFWLGLAFSFALGLFGIAASIFPTLREGKAIGIAGLVGLFGCAAAMAIAHSLLTDHVEKVSQIYFETVERLVEPTSGYSHATIFFFLEMLLPGALFLWWLAIVLLSFKANKKEAKAAASVTDESIVLPADEAKADEPEGNPHE